MARRPVFDPSDRDVFNEQRQRFDWSLLQNGFVYRYDTRFHLDSACERLTDLGYLVHRIDAHDWASIEDMHAAFAVEMSFPAYYGRNLDAFNDVLSDVATFDYGSDFDSTGTVLAIAGYDKLVQLDRRTAKVVLDIFAKQARLAALYGHPMLCLVESAATDFGQVGGITVSPGSVWDSEPDPPWPFHVTDIVEHVLQIYATDSDAAEYVAALRGVLVEALADIGRWQIHGPTPAPDATAEFHAEHRTEPPPPGTRLLEIAVGIRGEGDHTALGDALVHVLHDEGLRFDQMISLIFPAGSEGR